MKTIEIKVVKKNRHGHRWIEEPLERVAFRHKCKYRKYGLCDKGCYCLVADNPKGIIDSALFGCTPNAYCSRLNAWDKRHGIVKPFTFVEHNYKESSQ